MEEKESTISGSPMDSDTDSPPPVSSHMPVSAQPVMNINMNMTATGGGGGGGESMVMTGSAITNNEISPAIISSSVTGINSNNSSSGDLLGKKKRGRPRKYDSDGNLRVVQRPFINQQQIVTSPTGEVTGFCFSSSSPPSDGSKRGRGRPSGSGNWQLLASLGELFANTAGGDFTPHVVTVNTGEDVAGKILSFAQKGPRGICILSANGAVSNVTIRQPGSSGGILTYEGRFELLSLTGSFTASENGGVKSRTGGLSVSLASSDGRVIGGGVAGILVAASPIQIVLGSFMPNGYKIHKKKQHRENNATSVLPIVQDAVAEATPISQSKPNGQTYFIPTPSVPENSHGRTDNRGNGQPNSNPGHSFTACWNGTEATSNQRPSPDINISVLNEDDVKGVV